MHEHMDATSKYLKDAFFKSILHIGDSSLKLSTLEGVKGIMGFRNLLQHPSKDRDATYKRKNSL